MDIIDERGKGKMLSGQETNLGTYISIKARSLTTLNRRASFLFSFPLKCRASLTVEASLVLPLFVFYMMTILYSIEIVHFQSDVYEALHSEVTRGSFAAYAARYGEGQEQTASLAEQNIRGYLEEQLLPYLCVEGNREGIIIEMQKNVLGKDNRQLSVSYTVKPFIYLLPIGDMYVKDSVFIHDFTGYQKDGIWNEETKDIYVYITPTGKKYHYSETCTYLKVKLQMTESREVEKHRNADGKKYKPCEICGTKNNHFVYFTEWGDRYHSKTDCETIQRTVFVVPLSQVEGRTACSKCGG